MYVRARVRKERGGFSPGASTVDRRGDEPAESAPSIVVERDAGTETMNAEDQGGDIPPWSTLAASGDVFLVLDAETLEVVAKSERAEVLKPFAGFANFDACVTEMVANGKSEESARRICGKLQSEVEKAEALSFETLAKRTVPIAKVGEERVVYGIVLEPDGVDAQNDTISADEIYQAAHKFMEDYGNVGLQHQTFINGKARILQSYIAPVDFALGDQLVKKGTWLMAMRVIDDDIWTAVKSGVITGFSIGGSAIRRPAA